jgi:hypothetical protein
MRTVVSAFLHSPRFEDRERILGNTMDFACSLQCGWAALHLIGLTATFLMRAFAGARAETPLQAVFLLSLSGIGVAALAGEQFGWPMWILSAFTMGVMSVVAVADFSSHRYESHG